MTATLCLRPVVGEPLGRFKYPLPEARTVLAVAARHVIVEFGLDPDDGATPAVWFEEAAERARPVHVRLELVPLGGRVPVGGRRLATISVPSGDLDVYGTYLGPVSEEN